MELNFTTVIVIMNSEPIRMSLHLTLDQVNRFNSIDSIDGRLLKLAHKHTIGGLVIVTIRNGLFSLYYFSRLSSRVLFGIVPAMIFNSMDFNPTACVYLLLNTRIAACVI